MSAPRVKRAKRPTSAERISLSKVRTSDLPVFFENQLDPEANRMAAFGAKDPTDRKEFMAHWRKILGDPRNVTSAVLLDGHVVGHIAEFDLFGKPSVAYWYSHDVWGRGVATIALRNFLRLIQVRPIFARVAKDNVASVRVLEKCGFVACGQETGFAQARGAEIEELIFRRDEP